MPDIIIACNTRIAEREKLNDFNVTGHDRIDFKIKTFKGIVQFNILIMKLKNKSLESR